MSDERKRNEQQGDPLWRRVLGPEGFPPAPLVSDSGHCRSFEDTYRWLRPLLRRVPITRMSDLEPLDYVGLPSWAAVTPLARDLTTHNGKGRHSLAARISAIMEAIERTSAEEIPTDRLLRGSFAGLQTGRPLGVAPFDPTQLNLPFGSAYAPDREISWLMAYDLVNGSHRWLPADVVWTPAREEVLHGPMTNGLASGNNITEATVHALYEIIERQSNLEQHNHDLYADPRDEEAPLRMIATRSLPADSRSWVELLASHGMSLVLRDETTSIGVPVFRAIIHDAGAISPHDPDEDSGTWHPGWGADLEPSRAVVRAITEAVQARLVLLQGARDTFEGESLLGRTESRRRYLEMLNPTTLHPFRAASFASTDLRADLDTLLARLRAAGFSQCFVCDLTRDDIEVPVVRVVVPGALSEGANRRPSLAALAWMIEGRR